MRLLAIDTSTSVAGVCILENNKVLAELNINNDKKTHSQKLLPSIDNLMNEFGFKVSDFDVFAAVKGPGSFTGLRIGITTIKTFAYVYNKPIVGVPTLDVLAYNFPFVDKLVCPIIDARNSQVYTAIYKNNGTLGRITDFLGIHVEELVQLLINYNEDVIFVGDGIDSNIEFLKENLNNKCYFATDNLKYQKASSVAVLANNMFIDGLIEDSMSLKPFYLRKSQAERIRDEKFKE